MDLTPARVALAMLLASFVLPVPGGRAAEPRQRPAAEIARRAQTGDASASAEMEGLLEPLFTRKDLWTLDGPAAAREILRLLGPGGSASGIQWLHPAPDGQTLRLMTLDFGQIFEARESAASGYVAYAILEGHGRGEPTVSWFHDLGRRLEDQGGAFWHPLSARLLTGGAKGRGRTLAVEQASRPVGPPVGILLFEEMGGEWGGTRRLAAPGGGRLIGLGEGGAVFVAPREPVKGFLTGAAPDLFRSIVVHERTEGAFAPAVTAALPDVVSATESIVAALRRGDREAAKALCTSADVVEALQYFSALWKGGGRIVRAGPTSVEFVYEEWDHPTLRIDLRFENRGGSLLLASARGMSEKDASRD